MDRRGGCARLAWASALAAMSFAACSARHAPGDVCTGTEQGLGSCPEPDAALVCRSFTWHLDRCRGPDGCEPAGANRVRCDQRRAEEGDPCSSDDVRACSVDGSVLLRCEGSRMVPALACRGPRRCHRDTPGAPPACDQGGAEVGDPCEKPGASHCGVGAASVLRCGAGGRYVLDRECPGARGCFRSAGAGDHLLCDVSVGDVGQACVANGGSRCSRDARRENTCKDGVLVPHQECPGGCAVDWAEDARSFAIVCKG
jgi:hypothetical protein